VTIVNARPDVADSFADIPHEIRRRVTGGERVVLLLLDAPRRQPRARRLLDELWPELPARLRSPGRRGPPARMEALSHEMFVFDPDGFRIEIACGPPEETSA
jgi:hypothetical protein